MTTVDVVLATYNGEKYLEEQLESIASQRNVRINLIASDDGSTDSTIQILQQFSPRFHSFKLISGPSSGPAANFFFALSKSTASYVAFSDQDDIWNLNHLSDAISDLKSLHNVPALRFTSTVEFGQNITVPKIWPRIKALPEFEKLLMGNCARGCTFVFNKKTRNLICENVPNFAVMHDWWMLLQVYLNGIVIYRHQPEISYRLHENNAVGRPKWRILRFKAVRAVLKGEWLPYLQAEELLSLNRSRNVERTFLKNFVDLPRMNVPKKVMFLLTTPRMRSNLFDELVLRILLFLLRMK
jgi:glycosyltransferase involved in cell wall biosynthesis